MTRGTKIVESAHQASIDEYKAWFVKNLVVAMVLILLTVGLVVTHIYNQEFTLSKYFFGIPALLTGMSAVITIFLRYLMEKSLRHTVDNYEKYRGSLAGDRADC